MLFATTNLCFAAVYLPSTSRHGLPGEMTRQRHRRDEVVDGVLPSQQQLFMAVSELVA